MAAMFKFVPPGTIKQGYLVKSPPLDKKFNLDGWRKRWCVFTMADSEACLDYYRDEQEALSTLPIKRVSLLNCYQVVSDMKHRQKKNIFALHLPERVYYFSAPSHIEMMEWVEAFRAKLNLTHTEGSHLTMPATPPINRLNEWGKSSTFPIYPRSRTPDSPLPPIPVSGSSPQSPRPKPPEIPLPPVPIEASLNIYSTASPSTSPILNTRSASSLPKSESSKVIISVNSCQQPPTPPPHKKKSGSDEEEEEPLSPPPPPPRRVSPVPPMSSPPLSPSFDMSGDSPPPTPPPRVANSAPTNHYIIT